MIILRNSKGKYGLIQKGSKFVTTVINQKIVDIPEQQFSDNATEDITCSYTSVFDEEELMTRVKDLKAHYYLYTFVNSEDFLRCIVKGEKTAIEVMPQVNSFEAESGEKGAFPVYVTHTRSSNYEDCFNRIPRRGDVIVTFDTKMSISDRMNYRDKYILNKASYGLMLNEKDVLVSSPKFFLHSSEQRINNSVYILNLRDFLNDAESKKYAKCFICEFNKEIDLIDNSFERFNKILSTEYDMYGYRRCQINDKYKNLNFLALLSLILTDKLDLFSEIELMTAEQYEFLEARNQIARLNRAIKDANKIRPTKIEVKSLSKSFGVSRQTIHNMLSEINFIKKIPAELIVKFTEDIGYVTPHWVEYGYDFPDSMPIQEDQRELFVSKFNNAFTNRVKAISELGTEEKKNEIKALRLFQRQLKQLLKNNNINTNRINLSEEIASNCLYSMDFKIVEIKTLDELIIPAYRNNIDTSVIKETEYKKNFMVEYSFHEDGITMYFNENSELSNFRLVCNPCNFVNQRIEIGDFLLTDIDFTKLKLIELYKDYLRRPAEAESGLGVFVLRVYNKIILADAEIDIFTGMILFKFKSRKETEKFYYAPIPYIENNDRSRFIEITQHNNYVSNEGQLVSVEAEIIGKVVQVIKQL